MSRNGARTAEQKDARRYVRGEPAAFATLVLNGKLSVLAGVDGFRAEAGPWTVLGADALVSDHDYAAAMERRHPLTKLLKRQPKAYREL